MDNKFITIRIFPHHNAIVMLTRKVPVMPEYIEDLDLYEEEEEENEDDELDRGDEFDPDEDDLEDYEDEDEEDEEDDDASEDEEDDEDDEDDEDAEEDSDEEDEARIPKSRLDQVLSQRDAEKERAQWLEAQLEKLIEKGSSRDDVEEEEDPFDYDAAESKYGELLIEGETEKAAQVRALINRSRKEDMDAMVSKIKEEITNQTSTKSSEAIENSKFQDLVETYEGSYPELDVNSDSFDEDKLDMVNTLLAGYIAQGKSKIESLKLAVKKSIPVKQKTLGDTSRKVKARKSKADASNRQPPKTKSSKMTSSNIKNVVISKMSERDYDKLSLRERKILRGD